MDTCVLKGKHLIFLGSSVTYGSASGGVSFVEYIAKENGCSVTKEAVSGTTLADVEDISYIARLKRITDERADIFMCQLSTNDATRKLPLGEVSGNFDKDSFDTKTVAGAIEYIIAYAREKWDCPVFFYTNPRYESMEYGEMVELLVKIADKWKIGLLDFWNDKEFNRLTEEKKATLMADPIHPTKEGYKELWTPRFVSLFTKALGN